jgi:hypothetical protein
MTETSGRHRHAYQHELNDVNGRPPTRINSKHNFVCVEDDIVECISACIVMYSIESKRDHYEPPSEYSAFTKTISNEKLDTVRSFPSLPEFFSHLFLSLGLLT